MTRWARRAAFAAFGLAGLILPSGTSRAQPEPVGAGAFPWSAIGRVNLAGTGHCTGTLIGPNLVLTAAHCLYNERAQQWISGEYIRFVAGYERDAYLAQSRLVDYKIPAGYDPAAKTDLAKLGHDWALLILEQPIGNEVGYFGVVNFDYDRFIKSKQKAFPVARAGYSRSLAHVVTVDLGCDLYGEVNRLPLLAHACQPQPGDSGGPLLLMMPDGPRVIGVNNSLLSHESNRYGTAVPAATFYATAIATLGDKRIARGGAGYAGRPPLGGQLPVPISIAGPR